MRISVLILMLCTLVSCGPKSKSHNQGGQDNGGGNTVWSTEEEVMDAAERALDFMKELSRTHRGSLYSIDIRPKLPQNKFDKIFPRDKQAYSTFTANLKIQFQRAGDCSSFDNKHADASVEMGNPQSPICLSTQNLRRLPKNSLFHEIAALIGHEMAHMWGYGEEDAMELQQILNSAIAQQYGNAEPSEMKKNARATLLAALELITASLTEEKKNPNSPQVSFWAAEFIRLIEWQSDLSKAFDARFSMGKKDGRAYLGIAIQLYSEILDPFRFVFENESSAERRLDVLEKSEAKIKKLITEFDQSFPEFSQPQKNR